MQDRDPKLDKRPYHMLLLAKDSYPEFARLSDREDVLGFLEEGLKG